jgi:pimeloyl-ACP methyl ester carboxylesterase
MIRASILAALALAACQSAPPPAMETTADWYRAYYNQPQQVRLPDGRSMTLLCSGKGSPTVLFEAGLGSSALSWRMIQPAIAKTTRACSYDRAGLGGSDPGPNPRDVTAINRDLEALVKAAKLKGPFVLVGHSMGSYPVQMFAYRNPGQVAGMVTPRKCVAALGSGPIAPDDPLYASCIGPPPADMPAEFHPRLVATNQNIALARTRLAEYESFDISSAQLVAARRPLTGMPLVVLTASNTTKIPGLSEAEQQAAGRVWFDLHTALASLSDKSQHRTINAGHAIHREQPAVAIAAIEEVIAAARAR